MKTLVIVPAYNEEDNIVNTIDNLKKHTKNIDYIVINDGSSDSTKSVCIKNNINFLDLSINTGIGGAVQTGYKYAKNHNYDIAIQFDGDNQHDPKYIKELIKEIENGNDLVIGSRYIENNDTFKSTFARRIGIKILSFLIKLVSKTKIYDVTSGFRACNKNIINYFANNYPMDYPEPDSLAKVLKKGYKVKEIPVKMNERKKGKSSINFLESIYYMIKVSLCILNASFSIDKESGESNEY